MNNYEITIKHQGSRLVTVLIPALNVLAAINQTEKNAIKKYPSLLLEYEARLAPATVQ